MKFAQSQWLWLAAAAVAVALLGIRVSSEKKDSRHPGANIGLTRVTQLPVSYVENGDVPADRLALSAGAEDELPDGPASFDISPDGGMVVTDPLKQRLVFFDAQARFVRAMALDFTPSEVWLVGDGTPRVLSAGGHWLKPLGDGTSQEVSFEPDIPKADSARRTGSDRGFVLGAGGERSGFSILSPGGLASLEELGLDAKGRVYVALEIPQDGEDVAVRKVIRKYSADGTLLAEIGDVPVDYFVNPVREFKLKSDGKLYQMVTREKLVSINMWDTSSVP